MELPACPCRDRCLVVVPVLTWRPPVRPSCTTSSTGLGNRRPCFILLHHAGGASSIFHSWLEPLGAHGDVFAIDLPGRRRRIREPLIRDAAVAVEDIVMTIRAVLGPPPIPPFAVLGHSMGALLAHEIACVLRNEGYGEPGILFVSGSRAPAEYGKSFRVPGIDGADGSAESLGLCDELAALGARVPSPERLALLQADLEICRSHRPRNDGLLSCPIVALTGAGDPIATGAQVEKWAMCTTGAFSRREYPGSHFFLFDAAAASEVIGDFARWADEVVRRPETWEY